MKKAYILIAAAGMLAAASCKSRIEPETPSAGEADFTTYVAIGNSLTAGFSDGTLYRSGQENSYPNMLAGQFRLVGGGDFRQPLLPGEYGWPSVKRVLGIRTDCTGAAGLTPVFYTGGADTAGSAASIAAGGPYNNVGIPGIRCIDYALTGYGLLNPYAARFFSNPVGQKPLDVALQPAPTFFTMWLGSNDVLGYATAGGEGTNGGVGLNDISPFVAFKVTYDTTVAALAGTGAKGVLVNIPDVTSVPFFTTVPARGLVLTEQAQVDALNAAYGSLGMQFSLGANYFVIEDETIPAGRRQIRAGEYILLTVPQDSLKCAFWGTQVPIPRQYVLTEDEVANVREATAAFNQVIAENAAKYGLGLMDANNYLKTLQSGITWNGVTYTPTFVTGGAFSLDGIHLTPRGYALVANELIRVINQTYKATIPAVDINKYGGIRFP